ncbi:alanyl-tRNA editing protein [Tistrella mobilis]|uniref:alanyl-tRNA editing protein n=1 Tax=Tistrella mobilis TaxID=171437 RepID=UPI0035584728
MTVRFFWEDPYLDRLDSRVAAVDGDWISLDRTIFFAFSGGQESDRGRIGGHEVLEAVADGPGIRYRLAPDHGLEPGAPVTAEIDMTRRYRLMRLHFAAELVLELADRHMPGAAKIGAHIAEDKARIDFLWPSPVTPLLPAFLADVAELVAADLPIISAFSDQAAGRRYWEVEGVARVPCGGTHLRRTGEVGAITLKRVNVGKGKERIEMRLVAP